LLQVPKDFNVWSLDAAAPDITNAIIALNDQPPPSRRFQQ
jgi:hypothetical protein